MTAARAQDIYDSAFVKDIFDRCSRRYITFSAVCSLGFTERWRRQCVAAFGAPRDAAPVCYDFGTYSSNFGNAAAFGNMLRAEGLEVAYRHHFFGCATSISGRRPAA